MKPQATLLPPMPRLARYGVYATAVLVSAYALFCAFMAAMMGFGAILSSGPLPGVAFVLLAAFAVWYVWALALAVWRGRSSGIITGGLAIGWTILSWFVVVIGSEAYSRLTSHTTWSAKNYGETYGLGVVLFFAWLLTSLLLVRTAFADRLGITRPLIRRP